MLKSGEISPEQLGSFETSKARHEFFAKHFGEENAKPMNAALEAKFLLKNQEQGIVTWAKQIGGMKPETQRDLLGRVQRMGKMLENAEGLADLVDRRLGVGVTQGEAAIITDLSAKATETKATMEAGPRRGPNDRPTDNEMAYGRANVTFANYINGLKQAAAKRTAGEIVSQSLRNPPLAAKELITGIGGTSKALASTLDNSFIGRQGIQLFFKGLTGAPKALQIWGRTFANSFRYIWNTFGGKAVMDELHAEIISDPDYNLMRRGKVAIGTVEEFFPVQWPEKIPILGTTYKAAENAFTGSAYYMRYKTAKMYFDIARKTNVDLNSKTELESIGKLVNSLTARGETGYGQKPGLVNAIIWAPKMIKSQFDILTAHGFDKNMTPFARKQAALNLLQIISGTALVLGVAKAIKPDSVEVDPRSADFGKIKVGNTRFTVNPMASMVTLAVRLLAGSRKSTANGEIIKYEPGFGKATRVDAIVDFFKNKSAPAASAMINLLEGQNRFTGKPATIASESAQTFTPMSIRNAAELWNEKRNPDTKMTAAFALLAVILDGLGISTNTYRPSPKGRMRRRS